MDLDTSPFATVQQRAAADAELTEQLAAAFTSRTAADWEKLFRLWAVARVVAFEGGQPEFICPTRAQAAAPRRWHSAGTPTPKPPCCPRDEHNRELVGEISEPGTYERLTDARRAAAASLYTNDEQWLTRYIHIDT